MLKSLVISFFTLLPLSSFSQNRQYAKYIIDTLSSSSFFGRGYVNRGDSLAAEFLLTEFKRTGLAPVKNNYFQTFSHNVNTFPGDISLEIEENILKPGIEYLVDPGSGPGNGKSEIVEITFKDILENVWFQKIRKSGKKALYLDLSRLDSLKENDKKKVLEFAQYLKLEKDISANILILGEKGKMPWSVSNKEGYRAVFTIFKDSLGYPLKSVRYKVDAEYIENYRSKNLMGMVTGTTKPDSIIVVTAHYDHLGMMGNKTYFPGANDNASGVALLLDLSRHFKENPIEYSLCFIAFAGEEAGLLGSAYFVQNSPIPLSKIKFLVNLDLAGTGIDGITVVNGKLHEEEFNKLVKINSENNFLKEVKSRGAACNSDHCPFHQVGIKCFFLYTLGGTKYYHDIFDRSSALPLNEYDNYFKLISLFIKGVN